MTHRITHRLTLLTAGFLLATTVQAQDSPATGSGVENPAAIATPVNIEEAPDTANTTHIRVDENGDASITTDGAADNQEGAETAADIEAEGTEPEADIQEAASQDTGPVLPHDLSAWGMFMQADWVVKSVMIGLALASLATWTVFVAKTQELASLMRHQRLTLSTVIEAQTLQTANDKLLDNQGSTQLTEAAAHELKLSEGALADGEGLKERVASRLERIEAANGRLVSRGTSILASIGSTAPFVGLFGTVWGIMNSFIGISQAQTTNLAVVAPGIAEALLATALGLVAAIPAVVIYNHFARQIAAYKSLLGDTSAAVLRLVSRDLSRRSVGH